MYNFFVIDGCIKIDLKDKREIRKLMIAPPRILCPLSHNISTFRPTPPLILLHCPLSPIHSQVLQTSGTPLLVFLFLISHPPSFKLKLQGRPLNKSPPKAQVIQNPQQAFPHIRMPLSQLRPRETATDPHTNHTHGPNSSQFSLF